MSELELLFGRYKRVALIELGEDFVLQFFVRHDYVTPLLLNCLAFEPALNIAPAVAGHVK
ncbi:MAG: hypothetical protein DME55_07620 [Verrucomicrobia bacterium]|nr:MAG: hypothetical protein DME55_07620 [Verrucomicrobiota bacterium]